MKTRTLFLALLLNAACGGPAFTTGDDSEPLALETTPPLRVHDASADAAAGHPPNAAPASDAGASAPEAAPPPPPPESDANGCAPFVWSPPDASPNPFGPACLQPAVTASALVPAYYAVVTTKAQGCFLEPTPAACKCATDFSCACLLSQNLFCNGTGVVGCDDSSGAPVVTCQ